ncbi:hypothetical protein GOP47_0024555 [Adiantum capillus-veneris]|uniref:Rab3 GTPase-activating protein catalytic subunit n=1 Tax=Adiantum capillus-veneris TaxID=13818 RepID=A0A9D4U377_ADICA|nr:hypothetical protein GOP47_0024555 [Adiantum capillus-veneris]
MDSDSESEDLLLDDQGVFDDFTVASSWERLISDIEAACRKWQTGFAHGYLAVDAEVVDGHGKLRQVHCDLAHGSKGYRLDFYFDTDEQGGVTADEWKMERHHLQLWFGVQNFLVLAPLSMSGVILDAPEATLLLSGVSIALSNCGSIWPAFVPVHDPTRKAYKGIQGMRGPYCRSFEADRIGSQVPVKLMHLEGLYELFISKLAFSLPDSAPEYDGKIRSTVRLTYRTPMPGFEVVSMEDNLSPSVKPVENFDDDPASKVPWDDEYPWAQWYTVDDPIKGFELVATWSNRLVESSLDMAEFENVSTFEADKWLLAPVITQGLEGNLEMSQVSFASRMRNLLEAFFASTEAKFMEDFCTGDSPVMQKITSSTAVPPQSVLDRVLKSLLPEGATVLTMDDGNKQHEIARAIKGAPTNSLFAQFCLQALWFGNCNICAISVLWIEFVREVRWCWEEMQPLPRMLKEEENPSFDTCLVHQKLQLLAACIRRKAEEQQLHSTQIIKEGLINDNGSGESDNEQNSAADEQGREGSEQQEGSLILLKTREKMRIPRTQKPPIMTEDMLLEREHALVVLSDSPSGKMTRTRLQTSMLSSDMAAFKAANPSAVFEDFIRWHSPRDWLEEEVFQDSLESLSPSSSLTKFDNGLWPPRGKLSERMSHPDNIWVQLWNSVKPLPAHKQKPLFDHTREGEKVIHYLETLRPYQLLAQMICTSFASISDILYQTDIGKPKVLQVEIDQLFSTIVSILKPLRETNLSDKDVTENMEDWRTDIMELCLLLEKSEKHVIMAASFYQKLPDAHRLFSNLLSNYINLEKQRNLVQEVKLLHAVSASERVSIANLFPPVSLSLMQRRSLRMGNFLNGHEPVSREIIFSHFDHYSEGQRERYRMDGSNQWENILSHRMYIQGSANDLQVAYSVVSND